MKPFPAAAAFFLCTAVAVAAPEGKAPLSYYQGATSEQSCGGTGLIVSLRGEQVVHLDWTIETSRNFIRREYEFASGIARRVVETEFAKHDDQGEYSPANPRLVFKRRIDLTGAHPGKHAQELIEHAQFLVRDFQQRRSEFSQSAVPPN